MRTLIFKGKLSVLAVAVQLEPLQPFRPQLWEFCSEGSPKDLAYYALALISTFGTPALGVHQVVASNVPFVAILAPQSQSSSEAFPLPAHLNNLAAVLFNNDFNLVECNRRSRRIDAQSYGVARRAPCLPGSLAERRPATRRQNFCRGGHERMTKFAQPRNLRLHRYRFRRQAIATMYASREFTHLLDSPTVRLVAFRQVDLPALRAPFSCRQVILRNLEHVLALAPNFELRFG